MGHILCTVLNRMFPRSTFLAAINRITGAIGYGRGDDQRVAETLREEVSGSRRQPESLPHSCYERTFREDGTKRK